MFACIGSLISAEMEQPAKAVSPCRCSQKGLQCGLEKYPLDRLGLAQGSSPGKPATCCPGMLPPTLDYNRNNVVRYRKSVYYLAIAQKTERRESRGAQP
jgi:hypothetical protein